MDKTAQGQAIRNSTTNLADLGQDDPKVVISRPTLGISRDHYDPMQHKGLYLGVANHNRGKYFVFRRGEMTPLMAKLNSPEMHKELKGADVEMPNDGIPNDMRAALSKCLVRSMERDRTRGRKAEITLLDILEMYRRQRGRCALTGMRFVAPIARGQDEPRTPWAPTIDRINSRQGYILSNTHLVTVMANMAKSEFKISEFHHMCAHTSINLKLLTPREL